jgi:hypothetical protein
MHACLTNKLNTANDKDGYQPRLYLPRTTLLGNSRTKEQSTAMRRTCLEYIAVTFRWQDLVLSDVVMCLPNPMLSLFGL